MNYKSLVVFSFLLLLLGSCSPNQESENLEAVLVLSDTNRQELEKVLQHYRSDTLKYQAAVFLISNMPYHAYLTGKELDKVQRLYALCSHYGKYEIPEVADSFLMANGQINQASLRKLNDVQNIKADLLIDHIDKAFWAWEHFPWGKHVSFDNFCEYVLPYRVGNEVPSMWRGDVMKEWKGVTDSLMACGENDLLKVGNVVFDKLYQRHPVFSSGMPSTPCVGPNIIKYNVGSCRDMCDIVQYTFRALCIPCGKDFLLSGDYNTPHSWNNLPNDKGKSLWIDLASGYFKDASEYKDVKAKAFRETFSLQKDRFDVVDEDRREIPSLFRYPTFYDVTPIYADGKLMERIEIKHEELLEGSDDSKPYYLCIPKRQDWIPVDVAKMRHDKLVFRNFKAGTVICIAQYSEGKLVPCSLPMRTLLEKGKSRTLAFQEKKGLMEKIVLYTKFPPIDEPFLKNMIGGVVEGASQASFLHPDTLLYIKDAPTRLYSVVYPKSDKQYSYVRYRGADSTNCDISELILYASASDTTRLKGTVIGSKTDELEEQAKAMDGDPYNSYSSKEASGSWVGLRLSQPQRIAKIVYVPRNRDNFIRKGDEYELYYWSRQGWRSLGVKQAMSDCLEYKAPKGSLLYLRDLTRGNQERVFECKDGKQVWW